MSAKTFWLAHDQARRAVGAFAMQAPQGWRVRFDEPRRNLEQNAALWARLGEIAERVVWHGQRLDAAEWKDVFTAALKRQKVVPGIEGGFVVLGSSTSRMSKAEFGDLLTLIEAWCAERPEMQEVEA